MKFELKLPCIPNNIPKDLHKDFTLLAGIDLTCLFVHVYMIFLFHRLGILFMQRFNYFSVTWFTLLFLFLFRNKKNKWFCAAYGIMAEIILHQSLVVIFIGIHSGFQYFILVSAMCFTYFPDKRFYRYTRFGFSAIGILIFIWLSLRSRVYAPLYDIPEDQLTFLFILCCSLSLGIIICIMYASYRANEKALQELKKKNKQILAASEAKASFLANMSHEIRTPMNAILGMTDLILSEPISQPVREKAENIYTASRSLLTIINDILDFSKVESGKMEIINAEYRLSYILSDIYFLMAPKAETKALKFLVQIDDDVPDCLIGDEIRLKQVILNLVSNAVKYTENGAITIHISARPTPFGINLKLSVSDTGIGIRPVDIDKLFSSFTQVNTRQNRTIEGTGLGLSISKQLVNLMGGFINVESEYGKGSTFSIVLPQAVTDPTPIKFDNEIHRTVEDIRSQNIRIYNFTAPKVKILVVDDVDMNLKVTHGLLKPYQMQVDTALSGKECIEKLLASPDYDLVFMDHMMPGMDGVDTTKLIRVEEKPYFQTLPIIALTANALTEVKALLLSAGMDDFITKPIDMHDMYRILLRWLPEDKIIYTNDMDQKTSNLETPEKSENGDADFTLELSGVDIKQGLAYSGGKSQYLEFLNIYCESAEQILNRLRSSVSTDDWKQYEIDAHALKSTSASIGATALSALAKELEKAAAQGDREFIYKQTPNLLINLENLLQAIRTALPAQQQNKDRKVDVSPDKLLPDLERLAISIEEFMPDMDLLSSLLQKNCTHYPDYEKFLQTIQEALNRFDYDDAAHQLTLLLSDLKGSEANGEN